MKKLSPLFFIILTSISFITFTARKTLPERVATARIKSQFGTVDEIPPFSPLTHYVKWEQIGNPTDSLFNEDQGHDALQVLNNSPAIQNFTSDDLSDKGIQEISKITKATDATSHNDLKRLANDYAKKRKAPYLITHAPPTDNEANYFQGTIDNFLLSETLYITLIAMESKTPIPFEDDKLVCGIENEILGFFPNDVANLIATYTYVNEEFQLGHHGFFNDNSFDVTIENPEDLASQQYLKNGPQITITKTSSERSIRENVSAITGIPVKNLRLGTYLKGAVSYPPYKPSINYEEVFGLNAGTPIQEFCEGPLTTKTLYHLLTMGTVINRRLWGIGAD